MGPFGPFAERSNLLLGPLFLEDEERREVFWEGALVGGLVANEHGEVNGYHVALRELQGNPLKAHGALAEPEVLGHLLDEESFGWAAGLVLFDEIGEKCVEFLPVFSLNDEVVRTESVAAGVLGRTGFSWVCLGAGGLFGVPAVRFLLCSGAHTTYE